MTTAQKSEAYAISISGLHKSFVIRHREAGTLKRAILNAATLQRSSTEVREVLRGIDLEVPKGETIALIGRNGSGKSTLLSLIAGVYRLETGTIRINGTIAPLLELGAGFHPDLTGIENLEFYSAILGMPRTTFRDKVKQIVDFAFDNPDMLEKIDTPLRNYSEGMKMRLGFSVAIHTDPDILIVDEVLAVGDEGFQHKCYRKIGELQQAGKTILFVSHDMNVVRQVASRVVWLHRGRVRMDGPVEEVVSAYINEADVPEEEVSGQPK